MKFDIVDFDNLKVIEKLYKTYSAVHYVCPYCHAQSYPKLLFYDKTVRCNKCNKKYSWRTDTIFRDTKLSPSAIYGVIILHRLGKSEKEIANILKISLSTVQVLVAKVNIKGEKDGI